MIRYLPAVLLGTALTLSLGVSPLRADHEGRSYHDERGKDDHHWDNHEDKAFRIWEREQHHKHRDFAKLKHEEQEEYWAWRHQHSDALLKIDIR
jgi:hypothetical protein